MRRNNEAGFTLIEVLAALAIIAVALMAALRATGQGTSNVGELRSRLFASWVAENLLAEQRAHSNYQLRTRRPELYGELVRDQLSS